MSYNPSVKLCRLYVRTSKNGNQYLAGRLGAAQVIAFLSKEPNEHGQHYYDVKVQEPEDRSEYQPKPGKADHQAPVQAAEASAAPANQRGFLDDEIPFAPSVA